MRNGSIAPALDLGGVRYPLDGLWPAKEALQSARPDRSGPASIEATLARQCGASGMLVLWHGPGAGAQIVGSFDAEPANGSDPSTFLDHAIWAAAGLSSAAFGNERMATHAMGACVTASLALDGGTITLTAIFTRPNYCRMEDCRLSLESLLPLIRSYYEQWLSSQRALARMQSFSQAIDCSGMATILLGEDAEIIHANTAAGRIFAENDGLRRSGGRLACASYSDTLRLQSAIHHLHAEAAQGAGLIPVLAMHRAKRRSLTLALAAARPEHGMIADRVRAIAYVFDPEQDLSGIVAPVCHLHGLSHSEAKLTCALVAGQSLGMAAQHLGVREQTARSYLKQIFAKTQTNRQAELVQLMLKSAIRLSCESGARAFA